MIRISSQQVFSGGLNRLQELNTNLNNTQQQISTGKRINKPSDDPVAAARVLKLDQELARVETYQRNVNLADNRLKQEESALSGSVDIVQRVRELTVQAGNSSLSANDRRSISSELKQRLGQLANVANTKDASGEYIFSGFQGGTQAFKQDSAGNWAYQGDEGQRVLEIDDGVTVPISDHGKGIFVAIPAAATGTVTSAVPGGEYISGVKVVNQSALSDISSGTLEISVSSLAPNQLTVTGPGGVPITDTQGNALPSTYTFTDGEPVEIFGVEFTVSNGVVGSSFQVDTNKKQSVFGTIETLIAGLDGIDKSTPEGREQYNDLIAHSLSNLDSAQESFILKQTELGGRMNAVESTKNFLEDSSVYTNEIRSELQDVDYAEAISNLSFQSFILQAAQQSFARVSQLSLFDRI
jgi:flagellar hook-associated protein 3 FlgL